MGMESKPFGLQSPEQIAKEYGGNKQKIAHAMAMGLVDPTAGVLGGMFIDRMRSAQSLEQGPQQTVAQQVFAPQPAPPQAPLMGAPTPAPMAAPPMGAPPQAPPMGMASGGLTTLPVPDGMFDEPAYGGGGIVAFAEPGEVKLTDEMLIKAIQDPRTPENEREAARQELQRRRGPISDYGTPRTAEDTRAAFAKGLPQGLAEVGGALGSGLMNSEFVKDVVPAAEFLGRGAVGVGENYSKGYGTLKDAFGEAGGWLLGTDYKSRDQREAEAPPAAPASGRRIVGYEKNASGTLVPIIEDTAAPAPRASRGATGTWDDRNAAVQNAPAIGATSTAGADMRTQILGDNGVANVAVPDGSGLATRGIMNTDVGRQLARQAAPAAATSPETSQPAAGTEAGAISIEEALAKIRAHQGEAPGAPSKTDLAAQKKEDLWSTLAQMGFGIASGTSPNALVNIGQGAAAAMPAMRDAMKERRAAERENEKLAYEHQLKMWGYRGEEFKSALDVHMKDVDRVLKEQQLGESKRHNIASEGISREQVAASRAGSVSDMERYGRADPATQARYDRYLQNRSYKPYDVTGGQDKAQIDMAKASLPEQERLASLYIQKGQPVPQDILNNIDELRRIIGMESSAPAANRIRFDATGNMVQ